MKDPTDVPPRDSDRMGILCAGHWIVDHVKTIDAYPSEESLARILSQSSANGGCAYNVARDLARLDPGLPVSGAGLIGKDPDGDHILADCRASGIDTEQLLQTTSAPTAYTDVMTSAATGKRTFFYNPGTHAILEEDFLNLDVSGACMLHLGYPGLLDRLDRLGADGLTGCARLLKRASEKGWFTSTDLVSVERPDLPHIVFPTLPHLDILFLNEFEAGRLLGRSLTQTSGAVEPGAALKAAEELVARGVRKAVILHFPTGAVAAGRDGTLIRQGAVRCPAEEIVGTVGAGDAFASGVLYAIHQDWPLAECLKLGVCVAARSLGSAAASEAIDTWENCLRKGNARGFMTD